MADTNQQPDVDPFLKVSEVADMFGVTQGTIRVWINEGKLRAVKIGKGHYWRVPTSAAKQLAQELYGEN